MEGLIIYDTVKTLYNEVNNKIFSLFQVEIVIKNGIHNDKNIHNTIQNIKDVVLFLSSFDIQESIDKHNLQTRFR